MPSKAPEKVFVIGVGMTKFEKPGRREGWDYPAMAKESGTNALTDAGIDYDKVEAVSKTIYALAWTLGSSATRPKLNEKLPEQLVNDMKAAKEQGWGKREPGVR